MARARKQTTAQEIEEMERMRASIRQAEAKLKAARMAQKPTPGFAIEIKDDTELSSASSWDLLRVSEAVPLALSLGYHGKCLESCDAFQENTRLS